jgi:hypothetical protein
MGFNGKLRPNCSIKGCNEPNFCLTYCDKHYRRFKRHGDPEYVNPKCNRDGNYLKRARKKSSEWKKLNPKLNSSFNKARKTRMRHAIGDKDAIAQFYLNCPVKLSRRLCCRSHNTN